MTDWFREPHKKYGITYRMINLIVVLQLATIIGSRGNVYVLGEAYAFGVIWSFALKGLAMVVLRFKDRAPREWKVPLNIKLRGNKIPIGLGVIATLLFSVAGINLITKEVATISGVAFTLVFFLIFVISERSNERKRGTVSHVEMNQFQTHPQENVSNKGLGVRRHKVSSIEPDDIPGDQLCYRQFLLSPVMHNGSGCDSAFSQAQREGGALRGCT